MVPGARNEGRLTPGYLNLPPNSLPHSDSSTSNTSPIEPTTSMSMSSTFGSQTAIAPPTSTAGNARLGAGSPLQEQAARLFPRRTRELQAREGLSPNIWGPPASGNSTPLRETIPESPSQDGFPDLGGPTDGSLNSPARRARAGTVPSRFSPVGTINGVNVQQSFLSKTSRPTPSTSPFKPPATSLPLDAPAKGPQTSLNNAALLSRLRAGSLPQRTSILGPSNTFSSSPFSSNWGATRTERATTLTSIISADDLLSPTQSAFSREGMADTYVTLDSLGLDETPQQRHASLMQSGSDSMLQQQHQSSVLPQLLANFDLPSANRFRSYSVNAGDTYPEAEQEDLQKFPSGYNSGSITPSAGGLAPTAAQFSVLRNQINQHNLAVQEYARNLSAVRPRARTAGMLDTPQHAILRSHLLNSSFGENGVNSGCFQVDDGADPTDLTNSLHMLHLDGISGGDREFGEGNETQISRSLWIGSIPVSTTNTSLDAIFNRYGAIESTRILSHKNCGFVNFDQVESAVRARQALNGKEIFPGAGPVRIGFAKAPNVSGSGTPGFTADETSPTPDASHDELTSASGSASLGTDHSFTATKGHDAKAINGPSLPELAEMESEMIQIVLQFGESPEDLQIISSSIEQALTYQQHEREIPSIPEPSHARVYDAPRLRDIRKRIDNGACGLQEIEETANAMLPEIAELSSDYLGNTVVQKLFEFCSESTKEQMLLQIAPHLAEIGVHKNGTWAAQKIIDVCRTPSQMNMIVNHLRPYIIPLFLDQYGNYVLQCCLRFGAPFNNFIFEAMLSNLWEIAQGRFGSRAMRACLESHHATKHQQRMLAAAISLHSVQLATNTNGALLLTWLLDTCTFPQRRTVLAPRLVSHLVSLCTHKVAYLTVLKVINQRNEPEAREIILHALFYSPGDAVLERILTDQSSGATLIFKVLTTPFFDEKVRSEIAQNVAKVLVRIKAQPNQGYKRLIDEVGLSSRLNPPAPISTHAHSHPTAPDRVRPISQQTNPHFMSPQPVESPFGGSYMPSFPAVQYDNGPVLGRSGSADSGHFANYGLNGPSAFGQSPVPQLSAQQLQYQAFLAASQRNNNSFVPNLPTHGFSGYATPPNSTDAFRSLQNQSSPLIGHAQMSPMMNGNAFAQPTYNSPMNAGLYGYPSQNVFPHQMQAVQGGVRRTRR